MKICVYACLEFQIKKVDQERRFDSTDTMVQSYFEDPKQVAPVELNVVYEQLVEHESELAKAPSNLIDGKKNGMLQSLKKEDPQNQFSKTKNNLVDSLLSDSKKLMLPHS